MGNTGPKPSVKKALADGTATGFMKQSSGPGPGGKRLYQSWRWTGSDWEKVSKYAYQQWLVTQEYDGMEFKDLTIGPIGENVKPTNQTHRWPEDAINTGLETGNIHLRRRRRWSVCAPVHLAGLQWT